MDNDHSSPCGDQQPSHESERLGTAVIAKQESKDSPSGANKRSASGNLLARIPFLRTSSDVKSQGYSKKNSQDSAISPQKDQSNASSLRKVRSRRGSLRKAALLSLGKTRSDQEKEIPIPQVNDLEALPNDNHTETTVYGSSNPPSPDSDDHVTPRVSVDDNKTSRNFEIQHQESTTSEESLPMINISRQSRQKNRSITDEDESSQSLQKLQVPGRSASQASSTKDSYFTPEKGLLRKRTSRARSPLSALPIEPPAASIVEWDYSETEWWGWFILIVTWIVFVMGMGSCFEVWSWAWAVGKTPYAPPELEDDPTLPIVGYYPALIILTGVMAWIWVFTAWVGMKYFRHAKIS